MFILSGPYNSSFLGKSLRNINEPVLALPGTKIPFGNSYKINKKDDFEITLSNKKILTSLEDSLDYLNNNFKEHESVKIANLFKNKFLFRDRLARTCVFPKFEYQKIDSPTTITVDYIKNNPKVLKPVSGISSKNVTILNNIKKDFYVEASQNNSYILEKYIHGTELAVDGYYDSSGFPVIINITQHEFFSDSDVSDTLYWTNLKLVQTHIRKIEYLLQDIKTIAPSVKDFPFHMECRVDSNTGEYIPIEVNPLRFSGYGTCEIAHYAYNINPYKAFFKDKVPRWAEKSRHLENDKEIIYGFVCINKELEHRQLHDIFDEVLEYRFIPEPTETKIIVLFRTNDIDALKLKLEKII